MSAECRDCGSRNVAWATGKSGRRYLADTTGTVYASTYLRGPHGATCPGPRVDPDTERWGALLAQAAREADAFDDYGYCDV